MEVQAPPPLKALLERHLEMVTGRGFVQGQGLHAELRLRLQVVGVDVEDARARAIGGRRLVFGAWEPKTGAVGSLWDLVRDRRLTHRPQVRGGVLAAECAALLEDFFARHRDLGPSGTGP